MVPMQPGERQQAEQNWLAVGALAAAWPLSSVLYLAAYVLLDWASYIYPFAKFGITPWNPPAGLSFAFILLFGRRYIALTFAGPLVADFIVRGWPLATWLEFTCVVLIAGTYTVALFFLTAKETKFDARLGSVRDVVALLSVAVVTAAVASLLYVGTLVAAGVIQMAAFWPAAFRYWIGDVIGIAILTPFLLVLGTRQLSRPGTIEEVLQAASIVFVVVLVFALPASPNLQLLYLLFLPIIWIALRSGLERVTLGLILTQIVLIVGLELTHEKAGTVTGFQLLLLCLAMTGLLMGVVVSQQRRAERQLRLQQEALARVSRIGSMGVLGAAIAHEINQPLSAIATYADIVRAEIKKREVDMPVASEAAHKTIVQVARAADIVRGMRDTFRLGQSDAGPYPVRKIVDETESMLHDDIERSATRLQVILEPDLPSILADRIQIEQVLVNLIRNALDAINEGPHETRVVKLQAMRAEPNMVELSVHDSGPGFSEEMLKADVLPIASTKPDGMGLGLMICKSIVEAHGGRLWIDRQGAGGIVRFTVKAIS
ncbi:MAG: MASE1 domain-containing protein [Proteobacteria bacterium]|nr:MASE1 domain-containing protein [Pseudomonadota bacterium]